MASEKKGSIREQIVAEATRLFSARGFAGTALQEIADAVGIRKPSLLYHFASKDELRRKVLGDTVNHFGEVLPGLLTQATSGEGQFDAVVQDLVEFFATEPNRARLLLREFLDRPEETEALIREQVAPWIEMVAEYIRKGQARGRVHADVDPEAYVINVINLVLSAVALAERSRDLIGADRHMAELMRMAKTSLFCGPEGLD